jgi:integrase
MKRANSGLTWIRQKHVTTFLKNLALQPSITHESIDALPRSRTRDYVRGLLVEHGVLPRRDETKVRYQEWAQDALERLTDEANRAIIDRYIRWHHLRRMNELEAVSHGTFLRSKQTVTVAINFLNWLHDREIPLEDLQQADVDGWVRDGPTTRLIADRFLNWAMENRIAPSSLKVPRHRRGTSTKLSGADQDAALGQIVDGKSLSARDRAAAILVLVFGQQLEDVVALTWNDITVTDDLVTVKLGGYEIALNDPLDAPWRDLKAKPGHDQTAAHPNSNWLFRGHSPGQHINAMSLRDRLRRHLFGTRAARLGTLHELTKLAPVAIVAEALGYSAKTIESHASASGADYARYVGAIVGNE